MKFSDTAENMAVGVVTSFRDVQRHDHSAKGWLGNGAHGWCLFKDGDAAHGGDWKGGSYGQFAVSEGGVVTVIVDADAGTISFEVGVGPYPIVTFQYSSTALHQVSDHIR